MTNSDYSIAETPVQNTFLRNPSAFKGRKPQNGRGYGLWLPFRAVVGPHSGLISRHLASHPDLRHFAGGVDERAVFSRGRTPIDEDFIDWDPENSGYPLCFAFLRQEAKVYEIYCFEAYEVQNGRRSSDFNLQLFGITDLYVSNKESRFVDYFVGTEQPIEIILSPEHDGIKTDLLTWDHGNFTLEDDMIGRLRFLTSAFGDPYSQMAPWQ